MLRQVQKEIPFTWDEVDIESDESLFERYRYDIPVIAIDGRRAFKHRVEARSLAARLQRARGT